jgi:phenylalanyl-tRNA synthetase alpha chain
MMVELRAHEQKLLTSLAKLKGKASIEEIVCDSRLTDSAVMRAALILQEKNLVRIHAEPHTIVKLNSEGKAHAETGLPERRLIDATMALGGRASLSNAANKVGLEEQFLQIALGWTQRKKWATYDPKSNTLTASSSPSEGEDEKLLHRLASCPGQLTMEELGEEHAAAVQMLKKRQLLVTADKTIRILEITDQGKLAKPEDEKVTEEVTQLTPELIISGRWRKVKLQKYDIEAPVAKTWPGKKHPYLAFLEEVREKLVELGFKEMTGTAVETSLFNFDALYTPQDHPAREASGIYFVKQPEYGDISKYKNVVQKIKKTHENGWKTGSTGWKYQYSTKEAERLVLRSHGTCLSARTLISKGLKIPSKYFSIARVYRPEITDKTHLSEFNQVEGIVIDERLTLKDLLGVLGKFAMEIAGAEKIRFKPDYFPFTEPSVELNAYKEGYGWVEFGGSGIFRPEVTLPLGIKQPVIAWGLGVDRLFMMKAGISDIRGIFSMDLDWLRRKQVT